MTSPVAIEPLDLVVASALVVVAGLVSLAFGLGLGRRLAVAATRTVVQLLLLGYILTFVFRVGSLTAVGAMCVVMIVAAAWAAVRRPSHSYRGAFGHALATLLLTGILVTVVVTGVIIGVEPWYRAQYFIPLLGMVLGSSLTGISLGLDTLLTRVTEQRHRIEAELALGATSWEAAQPHVREAVRRGMIPIINTMSVVGLVSVPGMMTGQILAGADPMEAVKYQIVVMFMIAAATAIGCIGVVLLAMRQVFTRRHQLRLDGLRGQED